MRPFQLAALLAAGFATGACTPPSGERPVASAPVAAEPIGTLVPAEQFVERVRGNSMVGTVTSTGASYVVYVAPDLSQRVRLMQPSGPFTDQGRLNVEDGRTCARWIRIRSGAPACSQHRVDGETWRAYGRDGTLNATFVIRPGNPEGL